MSSIIQSVMVAVANGKIRSGGKVLIAGEIVEAFYAWPKRFQDMHLKSRKVVMVTVVEAQRLNMKAAEIRARAQVKQEQAEVAGLKAQLKAIEKMIEGLEEQRGGLMEKGESIYEQLKAKTAELEAKLEDANIRPEDAETDALDHSIENEVEETTGIKVKGTSTADSGDGSEPDPPSISSDEGGSPADPLEAAAVEEWANQLSYKELKAAAKELGVTKTFGVKQAELLEMVIAAKLQPTSDEE